MSKKILIIGAGVAGLQAHAVLQQAGYEVTLIDKGYKLGGRLSTRQKLGFSFDHGTAALSAAQMAKLSTIPAIVAAHQAGILQPASPHNQSDDVSLAETTMVAVPEMRNLCQFWAAECAPMQSYEAEAIEMTPDGVFCQLKSAPTEKQVLGPFDGAICTAPAPQTAHILNQFPDLSAAAQQASYAPQWCVMLGFDMEEPEEANTAALAFGKALSEALSNGSSGFSFEPNHAALAHVYAEHGKPSRPAHMALTLQASLDWSAAHEEDTPEAVQDLLLSALEDILGAVPPTIYCAAHRWRYARAQTMSGLTQDQLVSANAPIAIAGDWVLEPDIYGSLMTAKLAAEKLKIRLES
ncbi:MAG: NAD(P)/FAD-dependent oxidoreductase [Parvibaculales bacterium]